MSKGRKGKKTIGTGPEDDDTSTASKKKKSKKNADPEFAAFKPAPHLQKMILVSGATNPEELITHVRESMDNFEYPSDKSKDEFHIHMDRFKAWRFGVMMKQIPGLNQ
jgi:hypothetical protein